MMHRTFKIPYHHDKEYKVGIGSLDYYLNGKKNGEIMEMIILLPDEKDGLTRLEVLLFSFQSWSLFLYSIFKTTVKINSKITKIRSSNWLMVIGTASTGANTLLEADSPNR